MIREAAQKRRFLESGKWLTGEAYEEGVNELFAPSGALGFTLVNYRSPSVEGDRVKMPNRLSNDSGITIQTFVA